MEKLKKTARVLDTIARIGRGVGVGSCIAVLVLAVIVTVLFAGKGENGVVTMVTVGEMTISLGNLTLELAKPLPTTGNFFLPVLTLLLSAAVICALVALTLHLLHKILAPMTEGRPFDGTISLNLRRLGWLSLAVVLAVSAMESVSGAVQLRIFDLSSAFSQEFVRGYTVNYRFEAAYLLIPATLFLLSYIFRYGEELQRQSDETL